ncbi:MAG: nucleotide exchange factor GrpE [Sedimentisphaerales bacterium]|nr:nucleotide exchange factor GrpE [Sedimentisphaerales bacterium]
MKHKDKEKPKEQKQAAPKTDEVQQLHQQVESLIKEKKEIFEKLQRVAADYENFQKRVPRQIDDTIAYKKEKIIKTLLPTLDNFEHTLQNAHSAENLNVLVEGIRIIYDQMLDALKANGVEQINSLGQKFDPAMHEAIMQKAEADQEDETVLEEFQKGYKLDGRVIRPSRVIINKLQSEQDQQKEKPEPNAQAIDESIDTE